MAVQQSAMSDSQSVSGPSAASGGAGSRRPVSKAETLNPREFQVNQLRRRFRPVEENDESGTSLSFGLAPSDPDFPFELDQLQCILHVPWSYPEQQRPRLRVTNSEMEEAFQANVAKGFDDIVDTTLRFNRSGTLLGWMNTLDKQLERLLTTTERGPTLKFVTNLSSNERVESNVPQTTPKPLTHPQTTALGYTAEQKAQAEKRRAAETKQIEARLNRLPLFQKSSDEVSFIVPVQPTKLDRLPMSLRSIKTVNLVVPRLYPLESSSVELLGVERTDARPVETGFARWAKENTNLNLMSQINYLASNMHSLAKTPLEQPSPASSEIPPDSSAPQELPLRTERNLTVESEDRPHVHVVPRPPEWIVGDAISASDDGTTDESASEDFTEDDEEGGAPVPEASEPTPDRGVALSFPSLEFYGIELLELVALSITIKCDRCKEPMDVKNVPQIKPKSDAFSPRVETCKKCANSMSIGNTPYCTSVAGALTGLRRRIPTTTDASKFHSCGLSGSRWL